MTTQENATTGTAPSTPKHPTPPRSAAGSPKAGAGGPRLRREHMPDDFSISITGTGGLDRILAGDAVQRRQSMRGFEDTYVDIVDYIIRITHRIWEQKDFGYIYDTYRQGARIMGSGGFKASREEMVSESIAYSNAFPDLRLYADEVIWAGNDEIGLHTSHRLTETGHNTGWAEWGAPTGRHTAHWAIANCVVLENQIFEEWVLDNSGAMLIELGFDLHQVAREAAAVADPASVLSLSAGEIERSRGQAAPEVVARPSSFDPLESVTWLLHSMWNRRDLSAADGFYATNVRFHGTTLREYVGRGAIKSYVTEMLAMFPDLALSTDDIYWQGNPEEGYLVSARWSMQGTHTGHGPYGPPSGRRVGVWGINQYVVRNGLVVEEWNLFNELEALVQVYAPDAAVPLPDAAPSAAPPSVSDEQLSR